jgi:hypothetical protein
MHNTQASTSRSSNACNTFISGVWRHHFMIKEEFKHLAATRWVVREFKRWSLTSLFHPAIDMAYQCHVRLFYQNLSFDCEWLGVLCTSLDGVDIEVTPSEIALALVCPHECPPELVKRDGTPQYDSPPSGLTMQAIVNDICGGRYTNERWNCMRKSKLPSE